MTPGFSVFLLFWNFWPFLDLAFGLFLVRIFWIFGIFWPFLEFLSVY